MDEAIEKMARDAGLTEEELAELIHLFIASATTDIRRLEGFLAAKQVSEALRGLHSLKGAGVNLSLEQLVRYCEHAEASLDNHCFEDAAAAVIKIKQIVENLFAESLGQAYPTAP